MFTYSNDSLSHAARAIIDSLYDESMCRDHILLLDVLEAINNASDSQLQHEILTYDFDYDFLDYENINSAQHYANDENISNEKFLANLQEYIEKSYHFCTQFMLFEFTDIFESQAFSRMFSERVA